MSTELPGSRAAILQGLVVAAVLIAISLAVTYLSPEYLDPGLGSRLVGVAMGAVVACYANAVPKALSPLIQARCSGAEGQAIRRFTGWALVPGGLAYAIVWMVAPLPNAAILGAILLGAAAMLVVARIGWGVSRGRST